MITQAWQAAKEQLHRFWIGTPKLLRNVRRRKAIQRTQSSAVLPYEDALLIARTNQDMKKFAVIAGCTILLPEAVPFFPPAMLPSTFETPADVARRYHYTTSALLSAASEAAKSEMPEEETHPVRRAICSTDLSSAVCAARAPGFPQLSEWPRNMMAAVAYSPSVGLSFPFLTTNMMKKRAEATIADLRLLDEVLVHHGVGSIGDEQLREACYMRNLPCGPTEATTAMRTNLTAWVSEVAPACSLNSVGSQFRRETSNVPKKPAEGNSSDTGMESLSEPREAVSSPVSVESPLALSMSNTLYATCLLFNASRTLSSNAYVQSIFRDS
eukprot:Rmarinus@m.22594